MSGLRISEELIDDAGDVTFERIPRQPKAVRNLDGKRNRKNRDLARKRQRARKHARQGRV